MKFLSRRQLLVGTTLALAGMSLRAQSYPARVVRILVGYAPGGPTDFLARMFGERLARSLGQPVVVENIPGANGDIAARQLMAQPADGHTLMWGPTAQLVFNPATQATPRYDPVRDFTMIGVACGYAYIAVAPASLPVQDLRQFVEYAKANPGKLSYASAGTGTGNHLAGEWLNRTGKLDLTHVTYKGDAASVVDVMAGNVALTFSSPNVALPLVLSGKLKALAVTTPKRETSLPSVPTMRESGFDFTMELFSGLVGRTGMPADIVARLNAVINETAKEPEIVERLAKMAHYPITGTPGDFNNMVRAQVQHWREFVKTAQMQVTQ